MPHIFCTVQLQCNSFSFVSYENALKISSYTSGGGKFNAALNILVHTHTLHDMENTANTQDSLTDQYQYTQ